MADGIDSGIWLLIDAAGPVSVIGLVEKGRWLANRRSDEDFLETLEPWVTGLLEDNHLELRDLGGIIYACGPGSTLGLRLAAIFIRTLLQLPELGHWHCYQYQNLELAVCSQWKTGEKDPEAAVAPWRRDRLHISHWDNASMNFIHDGIQPTDAVSRNIPGFSLGRRHPGDKIRLQWRDYPIEKIPGTLRSFPWLLRKTNEPTPYSAEVPEFARWNPTRHSAK